MAFIFGKNKKKKEDANAPVSLDKTPDIVDTSETQKMIAENRTVRQEIEQCFRDLKDPDIRNKFKNVAEKNQEMLDKHAQAHQYDDSESENYSEFGELEKYLYIVPGGYREAPGETNNVPRANLDYYVDAIVILERKFKSTSSANAVESGADKLEVFVAQFLGDLREALEKGYAMKANAAIDMVKYIFVAGHRYESYSSDEERAKGIQKKVETIKKVGTGLMKNIDELYKRVREYKIFEEDYCKKLEELVEQREKYEQTCPKEVQGLLGTLGFKNAMAQLPPGDDRRKYLGMLLRQRTALTFVLKDSLSLEAIMRYIDSLKSSIDTLVLKLRLAFDSSGKEFDMNENLRLVDEINTEITNSIRLYDKVVNMSADAENELLARLDAIANNPQLGTTAATAKQAIDNYDFVTKQNELLAESRERRRAEYEVEKKKLELEREKHRAAEREQFLNEIRTMDEEIQIIREEANTVAEEPVTADNVNAEQAVDNRTVIAEEN